MCVCLFLCVGVCGRFYACPSRLSKRTDVSPDLPKTLPRVGPRSRLCHGHLAKGGHCAVEAVIVGAGIFLSP